MNDSKDTYDEENIDSVQEYGIGIRKIGRVVLNILLVVMIRIIDDKDMFHRQFGLLQYICICILYSYIQSGGMISWVNEEKNKYFKSKLRLIQGIIAATLTLLFSMSLYIIAFIPGDVNSIWYYLYGASLYLVPIIFVIEAIKDLILRNKKPFPIRANIIMFIMFALYLIWITRGFIMANHPPIQTFDTALLQNKTELVPNPREMLYREPFKERRYYNEFASEKDNLGLESIQYELKLSPEDEAIIMKQISDNGTVSSITGVEYMDYRRKLRHENYAVFHINGSQNIFLVITKQQEAYLHQLDKIAEESMLKLSVTRPLVYPISLNSETYQRIERYEGIVYK